jgi:hypothetical protein
MGLGVQLSVLPASFRFVCIFACLANHSRAWSSLRPSGPQRRNSTVNHNTTISMNDLPTDLRAVRRSKENKHSRDLTRLSATANGSVEALLRVLRHGRHDQRRPNRTGSNGVDADALGHPLVAEPVGEGGDGALGARVVEQVWAADVGVHASVVDDGVAFGHVWEGVLGEVEEGCWDFLVSFVQVVVVVVVWQAWLTVDVGVEGLEPLVLWNVQDGVLHHLERVVVDKDVDGAHVLQRLVDGLLASFGRSEIRLVQVDLAAAVLDHLLRVVGVGLLFGEVCDHDFCAFHRVKYGDATSDARVAAGDQGFAALELAGCLVGLHAAVVGWDLVYFGERIHLGLQAGVVLALGRWGLPAW